MISVDEALEIVLSNTRALAAELVPLSAAEGRFLAEDVAADADIPPFDRSAMDGYAVRAEDVSMAPVRLPVRGQIRAGQFPEQPLAPGTAIAIMTGAPLPAAATAVQQIEKTRPAGEGAVEILEPVSPGQNIAPRGSEVRSGDHVLEAGVRIHPATVAVLATVGRASVLVGRKPRVAVAVTGDEIVGVAEKPGPGEIRNSNGPAVLAHARALGADVVSLGIVPDDRERIAAAATEGLREDVLLLSGGVSAGAFDLVEEVLESLGVSLIFTKVALRPGAPLVFGRRGNTLVFGLPGNPVSTQVTFDLFVRPALLRMQGARSVRRRTVDAELTAPLKNRSGRRAYLPARLSFASGRFLAEPVRSMGSADLVAHARANALIVLDAERSSAEAGERVPAWLLGNFLDQEDP